MITLVIIFVSIWVGLYIARELTVPLERLVYGAQAVGSGNLDVSIKGSGHDEITVLVDSFNQMTKDLRDNRERLMKAQRELAWREVARRIAHEIKNPLTPIKLSAQRLQRKIGDYQGTENTLLKECTETIIKHVDEMKELVNEFSNFARFPVASLTPNDLNQALNEVVQLFKQAHTQIQFEFLPNSKLPVFDFDRDQLKRVLMNLLDNGVSALSSSSCETNKKIQIKTNYNESLGIAAITVQDSGPGISEKVKTRIFEPYFSTKSGGTGLGLAIVKRIINDHDGFIRVHSVVGEGTQFIIELPTRIRQMDIKLNTTNKLHDTAKE
ncbi:MAG: HAMP domain-containing protein [Deltaproteobacteria bacterium]|nr:HAMP domain-containing protein [Deltaproteobacteria bacterium]